MTRLYGWAPRGRRLVDKVPHGHWKTSTFLAALRCDRVEAPCLFDGPINGERFLAYVTKFLVPALKPDDIVVADNLGSHKGKAVRKAIRSVGVCVTPGVFVQISATSVFLPAEGMLPAVQDIVAQATYSATLTLAPPNPPRLSGRSP